MGGSHDVHVTLSGQGKLQRPITPLTPTTPLPAANFTFGARNYLTSSQFLAAPLKLEQEARGTPPLPGSLLPLRCEKKPSTWKWKMEPKISSLIRINRACLDAKEKNLDAPEHKTQHFHYWPLLRISTLRIPAVAEIPQRGNVSCSPENI